jgi:cyclic pyranopterin phosphate synthase
MKDQFGRKIEYLRISITENCNLKCIYCTTVGQNTTGGCESGLTSKEIKTVIAVMINLGVKKVRITGGEPLLRPDIGKIIEGIAGIKGIEDLSMTTNGIYLSKMAPDLKKAGLKRVNISLDSLKQERFRFITGGGNLDMVLDGINQALENDLNPIKINTVLVKGINDDEIDDFIRFTKDYPVEVRFIELMPIGRFGERNGDKIISNQDILDSHPELAKCEDDEPSGVAAYYRVDGYKGKVGLISPMSHKFCHCCNRIRLTCNGWIKPCLGDNGEVNVLEVLRNNPQGLLEFIYRVIYEKPAGHNFQGGYRSERTMKSIGG